MLYVKTNEWTTMWDLENSAVPRNPEELPSESEPQS